MIKVGLQGGTPAHGHQASQCPGPVNRRGQPPCPGRTHLRILILDWSRKAVLKLVMSWAPSTWAEAWMVGEGTPPGRMPVVVGLNSTEPNAGVMPAANRVFRLVANLAASTTGTAKGVE